jgi:hypothetical protein
MQRVEELEQQNKDLQRESEALRRAAADDGAI